MVAVGLKVLRFVCWVFGVVLNAPNFNKTISLIVCLPDL